jgi:hypothetical protein
MRITSVTHLMHRFWWAISAIQTLGTPDERSAGGIEAALVHVITHYFPQFHCARNRAPGRVSADKASLFDCRPGMHKALQPEDMTAIWDAADTSLDAVAAAVRQADGKLHYEDMKAHRACVSGNSSLLRY